ncbi:MAG: hypothetical protein E6Q33_07450, partial [Neisseriales bacterium]
MILISQTEFAALVGEKPNEISKMIVRGQITAFTGKPKKLIMPDAKKQYHLAKSGKLTNVPIVEVFNSAESEDQPIKNNQNADMQDLLNVKVRKETILADNHEINLKKALGKLVSIEEVNKTVTHG